MVSGPRRPPQEVVFVVTVPFRYCGGTLQGPATCLQTLLCFPRLVSSGCFVRRQGGQPSGERPGQPNRGREMGANSSCFVICSFMEEGIRFRQFDFGEEVEGKQLSFSAQREEVLQG